MKVNFYNGKKLKYLNMLNSGKAKKNSKGDIIKEAKFQSTEKNTGRIEPARSWFGSTKTMSQNELDDYRSVFKTKGPYDVLLKTGNVPYSMINNDVKVKKNHDFKTAFGTKSCPKRPKLTCRTLEELKEKVQNSSKPKPIISKEKIKGQSHRIWNELYKVIDSSDVIVHVLDARDPMGTRCSQVLEFLKGTPHKHLMYVLNKVDLIPTDVTAQWIKILGEENPTIAYHSNSLENFYGRDNLMNLFRQLRKLYDKETLSIGFIGYPNTGKSSIINTLRGKDVCKTAPVPGETRCWQYITLMKDLYLIDCPGVVPVTDYDQAVLKGAIRVENVEDPEDFIDKIIDLVSKESLERCYNIKFNDLEDFFDKFSKKYGKISKGGVPNVDLISKIVLHDLHRGKIAFYVKPNV